MIRVLAPPTYAGMTRTVRSQAWAEERARRVAQLAGSAEIQRRESRDGEWETISRFTKAGNGSVARRGR